MSEIQVNGYVRVPKGTMVYPTGDGVEAPSTRDRVVKVAKIFDVDVKSDSFYLLLPGRDAAAIFRGQRQQDVPLIPISWNLRIV